MRLNLLNQEVLGNALYALTDRIQLVDCIDILIVAVIIYELIVLTRQTRGSAVMKGLLVLLVATGVSMVLGFNALRWLLRQVLTYGTVVLVVLFQPELRKALEQMGRGKLLHHENGGKDADERERVISEIIQCLTNLSRRRVGALIVFERQTGLKDIIETGTEIDARISAPLLENIFEPNTPLHDGAVIIRGTRVVAGACILTLTESLSVSRELGTRHRAAIGVSETTDSVVLIVSEETGIISMAKEGRITRHLDAKALRDILSGLYEETPSQLSQLLQRVTRKGKEAAK